MFDKCSSAWHAFWFKETSPAPLCLFRIFFGLFVFQVSLFELAPNFSLLLGVNGMFDTAAIAAHCWGKEPVFNVFLLLPQSDNFRFAFFCLFLVFAFFLTTGLFTRVSALIVYLGLLTFDKQCPFALDGGDDFMRLVAFLLIFSPAGEAYSLDRILQAKIKGLALKDMPLKMVSPWLQRMIQIQISLAYLFAFLPKIVGEQWQSGTAIYYAFQLTDFAKFPVPNIITQPIVCKFLNYYTLLVELSMATLVWIKPLRYWILLAAILLHLGIDWAMNLPCFELLFISSYVVFVEPDDLQKIFSFFKSLFAFKLQQANAKSPQTSSKSPQTDSKLQQDNTKPQSLNLVKTKVSQHYNHVFLPTALLVLFILIIGSSMANPIRRQYVLLESQRAYDQRLAKAFTYWNTCFEQTSQLAPNDDNRLKAEEGLGVILSLQKKYIQSGKLLRLVCAGFAQQNKPYNPELINSLTALAGLYLETYHLDAAEFCYKTILDYDIEHFNFAPNRSSIELNNLGVIAYFRALLAKDKDDQTKQYIKAEDFFGQALAKSHNSKLSANVGFRQIEASILLNQSLPLRDLGRLQEAERAKRSANNISSASKSSMSLKRYFP